MFSWHDYYKVQEMREQPLSMSAGKKLSSKDTKKDESSTALCLEWRQGGSMPEGGWLSQAPLEKGDKKMCVSIHTRLCCASFEEFEVPLKPIHRPQGPRLEILFWQKGAHLSLLHQLS